jgi:hypothetical protein
MSEKKGFGEKVLGLFVVREGEDDEQVAAKEAPAKAEKKPAATAPLGKGPGKAAATMGDPQRVPQTPPARPGPPPAALKGSEIPPVIAGATPDAAVFAKVYRAADISEAEQERVEKTLNLLQSLPAETPREVKKQIVEASLKAFGIPVDQIIQAGAQEIQALDAYIKHGEQHTQEVLADASARVAKLEAEIGEVRRLMDLQVQTQLGLTRATTNEKLRVQAVLEFFEPR